MLKTNSGWFIPISIGVTVFFSVVTVVLAVVTLIIRNKTNKKYDRGKLHG